MKKKNLFDKSRSGNPCGSGQDEPEPQQEPKPEPEAAPEPTTAQDGAAAEDNGGRPRRLHPDAMPGVIGEIMAKVMPTTEACESAVLLNLLTAFGSIVGRDTYTVAGNSRHHPNLFVVLCGDTAKGRKGTSWDVIEPVLYQIDPTLRDRINKGLGTGQGLIHSVRDPMRDQAGEVTDPGVTDKRLLVMEGELAGALRSARGRENILSATLREAWDGKPLQTLTKNQPERATDAHVSVIGHITKHEALDLLTATDSQNGHANRYLWSYAYRSKWLPFGAEPPSLSREATVLHRAYEIATADLAGRCLDWSNDAKPLWADLYVKLSRGKPGVHGAVTARAEAHVKRLALVYAVTLGEPALTLRCLRAALALWDYCDRTAEWIFGTAFDTPEARKIYNALRDCHPVAMRQTEITQGVLHGHASPERVEAAREELLRRGLIRCEEEKTAGRNATLWKLCAE